MWAFGARNMDSRTSDGMIWLGLPWLHLQDGLD